MPHGRGRAGRHGDLRGAELIEDRQSGLAGPLARGLDDLGRLFPIDPRRLGRYSRDRVAAGFHVVGGANHQCDRQL